MSRNVRAVSFIVAPSVVLVALGIWVVGNSFGLWAPAVPAATHGQQLNQAEKADMNRALELIHKARDRFARVKDYSCIYLRNEFIDDKLHENQLVLKVRHEPFSVYMEWVAPGHKSGRKAAYVQGQNGNKMKVKVGFLKLERDPEYSLKMKESRHTIKEAGLKNMIDRFCKSWEEERKRGNTEVLIQEGKMKVTLQDGERTKECICITTIHDTKERDLYTFYRTLLYLDKDTGLPVRMQGYDWPKSSNDRETQLLEDFTYLDLKENVGLADKDFSF